MAKHSAQSLAPINAVSQVIDLTGELSDKQIFKIKVS